MNTIPMFNIYLKNGDFVEAKSFCPYEWDEHFIKAEGIEGKTYYVNRDFIVKIVED